MNDFDYDDMIRKASKHETWGGKTRSPTTRFTHLLSPPEGSLGNWHIATASHFPRGKPALDWQIWNISKGKAGDVLFTVHVFEYPTVYETHESLLQSLMSITKRGLNYTPEPDSPGDVLILDRMARDNILVTLNSVQPVDA